MQIYRLRGSTSLDAVVREDEPLPAPKPNEIVVRVRAASLNRRDIMILHGTYPLPAHPGVVPLSDGAGEVVAVGEKVSRFQIADRVISSYFPRWIDGRIRPELVDQPRCTIDGMLTEYAILDQQWAVAPPDSLSFEEGATLSCAGLTAWNAVTGPRKLVPGQTVLTIGTGGVSLFALQAFPPDARSRLKFTEANWSCAGVAKRQGAANSPLKKSALVIRTARRVSDRASIWQSIAAKNSGLWIKSGRARLDTLFSSRRPAFEVYTPHQRCN